MNLLLSVGDLVFKGKGGYSIYSRAINFDAPLMENKTVVAFHDNYPAIARLTFFPINVARGAIKFALSPVISAIALLVFPFFAAFKNNPAYNAAVAFAFLNLAIYAAVVLIGIYASQYTAIVYGGCLLGVDVIKEAVQGLFVGSSITFFATDLIAKHTRDNRLGK